MSGVSAVGETERNRNPVLVWKREGGVWFPCAGASGAGGWHCLPQHSCLLVILVHPSSPGDGEQAGFGAGPRKSDGGSH